MMPQRNLKPLGPRNQWRRERPQWKVCVNPDYPNVFIILDSDRIDRAFVMQSVQTVCESEGSDDDKQQGF